MNGGCEGLVRRIHENQRDLLARAKTTKQRDCKVETENFISRNFYFEQHPTHDRTLNFPDWEQLSLLLP